MKTKTLCPMLLAAMTITNALPTAAQDKNDDHRAFSEEKYDGPLNILLDTRVDYQREYLDGNTERSHSGFKGKYLMLTIDGNITDKFSYSFRQRLNELHHNNSFFDGTDKMLLTYKITPKWEVTGGKMGMYFGSWEYDRNPMYIYNYSEWTNQIACYKFGAMLTFNATDKDHLYAQFMESPFNGVNGKEDMYSYHLAWYGFHDWIETVYSANALEYRPGKYIYYLCLGNRLKFGKATLEFDFMNRATENHTFFFKDYSLIGELAYAPNEHWSIFGKSAYTVNKTHDAADFCVRPGTELTQVSGGLEFFPLKGGNKDIRLHAMYGYNWGKNANPNGVVKDDQHVMSVGVQWRMDLVDLTKKIWNKTKK